MSSLLDGKEGSFDGVPVALVDHLPPGKALLLFGVDGRTSVLMVGKPSAIRTYVWDSLHERVPWLRGGDDQLSRLLLGVEVSR